MEDYAAIDENHFQTSKKGSNIQRGHVVCMTVLNLYRDEGMGMYKVCGVVVIYLPLRATLQCVRNCFVAMHDMLCSVWPGGLQSLRTSTEVDMTGSSQTWGPVLVETHVFFFWNRLNFSQQ